jgi:ribosomal protein S18 acetylase RimI-like enzyme
VSEAETLRPATEADLPFLLAVYASTRTAELAVTGWDDATKDAFLRQQFEAQHRHYQEHYRDTSFDVILAGGVPAGRLYVARWPQELRIVEVALLPAFRGQGIGSGLLRELLEEGAQTGRRVSVHVEKQNPAKALYERLGFRVVADEGVYELMEAR